MNPSWLIYHNHLSINLTSLAAGYRLPSHYTCDFLLSISWLSFLFGELILRWVSSHGCKMPAFGSQSHILLASSPAEKSLSLFLALLGSFPGNHSDWGVTCSPLKRCVRGGLWPLVVGPVLPGPSVRAWEDRGETGWGFS